MTYEQIVLSEIRRGHVTAKAIHDSQPKLMLSDIHRCISLLRHAGRIECAGNGIGWVAARQMTFGSPHPSRTRTITEVSHVGT